MNNKNNTAKSRRTKSDPNARPVSKSLVSRLRECEVPWGNVDDVNWLENFGYLFFHSLQLDSRELGWLAGIASQFATKNEAAKAAAELMSKAK